MVSRNRVLNVGGLRHAVGHGCAFGLWVSTAEQSAEGQLDALRSAGVERVWTDVASGMRSDRPALAELVEASAPGDVVVVCRLDRLGRSLPELLALVQDDLAGRGVGLWSLGEQIDTTSAAGRLVLHVFGALAEFCAGGVRACSDASETVAGLAAARVRGRVGWSAPGAVGGEACARAGVAGAGDARCGKSRRFWAWAGRGCIASSKTRKVSAPRFTLSEKSCGTA